MAHVYNSIMSLILREVPMIKPANATQQIKIVRMIIQALAPPYVVFHLVQQSKNDGKRIPNVDNVRVPINEMKMPKFGTATANTTTNEKETD